jgi:hypothetical protein
MEGRSPLRRPKALAGSPRTRTGDGAAALGEAMTARTASCCLTTATQAPTVTAIAANRVGTTSITAGAQGNTAGVDRVQLKARTTLTVRAPVPARVTAALLAGGAAVAATTTATRIGANLPRHRRKKGKSSAARAAVPASAHLHRPHRHLRKNRPTKNAKASPRGARTAAKNLRDLRLELGLEAVKCFQPTKEET